MLVIKIELWPGGDASRARLLHKGTIINVGPGTPSRSRYYVRLSKRGNPADLWRFAEVNDFPRKRLGAWDLLYRGLREAVGGRNP